MDSSQMASVDNLKYQEPSTGERVLHLGEEEQQHEKKSVIKKVKEKAKKLKETIGKKMHDNGHEEQEDEEEESEPEVHGAPIYESTIVHEVTKGSEEISSDSMANLGNTGSLEEDPQTPKDQPESKTPGNYETKVGDPTNTGGDEAGMKWVLPCFQEMKIHDETETETKLLHSTGSHGNFSPDDPAPEALDSATGEEKNKPEAEKSYGEKIYSQVGSFSSVLTDTAVSAKNVVTSKLGYGDGGIEGEGESGRKHAVGVTEMLGPLHGKGLSVKDYVMEKLKPSEDDRALSEVITETMIHGKKEDRALLEGGVSPGKVTHTGGDGAGAGVMERLKGVVSSLLGKNGEVHEPLEFDNTPRPSAEADANIWQVKCKGSKPGEHSN